MCSVNFWQQQDYNTLFKGSIGRLPLSAIGLLCQVSARVLG